MLKFKHSISIIINIIIFVYIVQIQIIMYYIDKYLVIIWTNIPKTFFRYCYILREKMTKYNINYFVVLYDYYLRILSQTIIIITVISHIITYVWNRIIVNYKWVYTFNFIICIHEIIAERKKKHFPTNIYPNEFRKIYCRFLCISTTRIILFDIISILLYDITYNVLTVETIKQSICFRYFSHRTTRSKILIFIFYKLRNRA